MSGQEKLPPVRVWCQALPVPEGPDVVATARARRRAAAGATRAHLQALFPGLDPASLRRGPHGKPYLPPPWERFGFNPSDSGGWFLFGVVEGTGLGVDLERRRPRPRAMDLARRHFSVDEVDWLATQDDIVHRRRKAWSISSTPSCACGP
jgi:phosphopantetheinyl transferase